MGVYVKGLEMPKKCINCKFCVDMNDYPFHACFITDSDIPFDIDKLENCPLVEIVTCGECIHFHYDKPYIIQGIPVLGHEVCDFWGDGCKTNPNGFCSHGERRENL